MTDKEIKMVSMCRNCGLCLNEKEWEVSSLYICEDFGVLCKDKKGYDGKKLCKCSN
ncbi:hypothetical protein J2750_001839 [Methanococcoides alaskense]|uniref:Uncharacterized protein n=1 Tax=Methanococcoides alaskense TaxID=325778 RepID=A0AA90Z9D5_9EURY|nr:hypothetical protein [Methanococcoides alaskense]